MPLTDAQRRTLTRFELPDPAMTHVLRALSPSRRLATVSGMWKFARDLALAAVRVEHPDWSDEAVNREAVRRLSHGAV